MGTNIRLAFLDIHTSDNGSVRGGILTTDVETIPQEFVVTEEIQPNKLQKLLYGGALDRYIDVHLIALPLLSAIKEKPTFVLAKKESIIFLRNHIDLPVYILTGDDNSVSIPSPAGKPAEVVRTANFVRKREYPSDDKAINSILKPLTNSIDLFEPFDRLQTAIQAAHVKGISK